MRITSLASIGALGLTGLTLAGCGGSSSSSRTAGSSPGAAGAETHTVTERSRATPAESNADVGKVGAQLSLSAQSRAAVTVTHPRRGADGKRVRGGDIISPTHTERAQATATSNDDRNTNTTLNPCRLVSLSQAEGIAGSGITTRIEAPLGPTCIYGGPREKSGVTLALETRNFTQATRQLSKRKTVVVSGHTSYCGQFGASILLVPLGTNQVLNVTAPCGVAQQFAARALQSLSA